MRLHVSKDAFGRLTIKSVIHQWCCHIHGNSPL
jgi:hypothetical protein